MAKLELTREQVEKWGAEDFSTNCEKKLCRDWRTLEAECEKLKEWLDDIPPKCGECGHYLTVVRPGKHQCDFCEGTKAEAMLKAENARLREAMPPVESLRELARSLKFEGWTGTWPILLKWAAAIEEALKEAR